MQNSITRLLCDMADALREDFPLEERSTESWFKRMEHKLALLERFDEAVLCKVEDEDDILHHLDDDNPVHAEASLEIRLLRREIEHMATLNNALMNAALRKGVRP